MLIETNSAQTHKTISTVDLPWHAFVSKVPQSSSLRPALGPCSGTDLPISEWHPNWKKWAAAYDEKTKALVAITCQRSAIDGWISPEPEPKEAQSLFIVYEILRLCYTQAQKPALATRQEDSTQAWFLISRLTSQLLSPAPSISMVASAPHTWTCLCFSSVS